MGQSFKHDALALDVERINVFYITSLTTRRHPHIAINMSFSMLFYHCHCSIHLSISGLRTLVFSSEFGYCSSILVSPSVVKRNHENVAALINVKFPIWR
jgi:hypothetical protein